VEHFKLLVLTTNIRVALKGLPGTNTPAYLTSSKITAVKMYITIVLGIEIIKLIFSSIDARKNKLVRLSLAMLCSLFNILRVKNSQGKLYSLTCNF
jgi:hypothetical protein